MARTPVKLPFCLAGVFLATIACADAGDRTSGDPPTLEAVVHDSADVRIVENPRPSAGSRLDWRVGAEPAVSIGKLAGEDPYLLDRIQDALVLPDDRIVVANGGSNELRVFDALGSHVATWGGRGEGPGEFTSLILVHRWPGDSLIALYSQGRRVSVLDSAGNYGRAFTLQRGDAFFLVESILPGGAIVSSDLFLRGMLPDGLSRPENHYRIRDAEGELGPTLGSFPGTEWFFRSSGGGRMGTQIPFAHQVFAFAWGNLAAVAPNDTYEIRAFDLDGTLKRIVRRDHDLVAPTPAHIDAHIERAVAARPEEEPAEVRQRMSEYYLEVPLPETYPAYAEAMSDLADHLWVREFGLPGAEPGNPVWTVFDPDGQVLGYVETPAGLQIFEIGEDYILGRATDDLGVEYVQVWSLERSD
ncbi:MAG: hypothetical protein F4187_10590 [Gemmatimonadetes bacterium]|nr:hypothetical protein [Gemmatimonadota bacterium]